MTGSPDPTPESIPSQTKAIDANSWWKLADYAVFSSYVAAVFVVVAHHEPWADEAQAWLVARDLPFWKMLFRQMHYEISPGLWHVLLWVAQHVFHAPYSAMNWIGAVLAAAGAGVLIFCSPFPRPVRYLMSFSFYVAYQYAVVARPYVMLLLFGGLAALFYRRRAPVPFAIAIALLCGTSVHGCILAFALCLGAAWHVLVKRDWPVNESRNRYLAAVAIIVLAGIMVVVIARPAVDAGGESRFKHVEFNTLDLLLTDALVGPWAVGACVLLALTVFALRSGEAIVFVSGVGGLLAFEWLIFSLYQHRGVIVIALIVCLWVAWPKQQQWSPELTLTVLLLSGLFGIQTFWAVKSWRNDYVAMYSGSKDAAAYLHRVGADHANVFGFCFPVVAIQPYFDRSIFQNWPTAYLHMTQSEVDRVCVLDGPTVYDYLVVPVLNGDVNPYDNDLRRRGYFPVHLSPGRIFFKQGTWMSETFVIYRHRF